MLTAANCQPTDLQDCLCRNNTLQNDLFVCVLATCNHTEQISMFRLEPWRKAIWFIINSIRPGQSEPDLWWHSTALTKQRNYTSDIRHKRDHVPVCCSARCFTVLGHKVLVGRLDCADCWRKCSFSPNSTSLELTCTFRYFWYPCRLSHYIVSTSWFGQEFRLSAVKGESWCFLNATKGFGDHLWNVTPENIIIMEQVSN